MTRSLRRHCRRTRPPRRTPGMTLLEVGVALVVVAASAAAVVQLINVASLQRRTNRQRQVAYMELANQAERLALLPWSDLVPERLASWTPSEVLLAEVPTAQCSIAVGSVEDSLPTRRIDLSVSWNLTTGQPASPARLTLWKHHPVAQP